MTEFHILLAGIEIGPLTERQVRAYLTDGLVSPSDPARMDRMTDWEPVEILLSKIPQPVPITTRLIIPEVVPPEPEFLPETEADTPEARMNEGGVSFEASAPGADETVAPTNSPTSPLIEYTARANAQKAKRVKSSKIVMAPLADDRKETEPPPDSGVPNQGETGSLPVFAIPPPRTKKPEPIKAIIARKQAPAEIPPAKKVPEPVVAAAPPPLPPLPRPKRKRSSKTSFGRDRSLLIYTFSGLALLVLLPLSTYLFVGSPSKPAAADDPATTTAVSPDTKILSSNPHTAVDFTQRGFARYNRGEFDLATSDYNQAILLDPNYMLAYFRRGLARQSKSDWNGALVDFNQALKLDPRNANAFASRAFVKQSQGDLDGAIADYTQALMIDPKIAVAFYNRGVIKKDRGDRDGALLDFNHALDLNPDMAAAYFNRGEVKNATGNQDGAVADYTHALALNPRFAAAYYNRGFARQAKGDVDGAYADYSQALTYNPRLADAYYKRGLIRAQRNDLDGSIDDNTKVLELDPQNPQPYCNRGLSLMGKGHLDLAMDDLHKFCRLVPREADTDYARLYLWLIATEQNPEGSANTDLANAFANDWNSPPGDLSSRLAKFLLDRLSEKDLFAIPAGADPLQESLVRCKAWYFAGMKRLFTGDQTTAIEYFRIAVATDRKDCCEYIFALNRLKAMGQSPRAPVVDPQ